MSNPFEIPVGDEQDQELDEGTEASKDEGIELRSDSTLDEGMELLKHEGTEVSKDEGTKPWSATVFLKEIGRFSTLKEAAHASFKIIDHQLKTGQVSWMALDTTIWIENVNRTPARIFYNFYDWRDMACENGWLVDGKWIDN